MIQFFVSLLIIIQVLICKKEIQFTRQKLEARTLSKTHTDLFGMTNL